SSSVSVDVSPGTLAESGDDVTVRWSGIERPSDLDWLGIYSPANSSHRYFIGYFFLSSSPGWESGSGSITFPLINLRSDYQFRIFHWDESEVNPKKLDHDHNPIPGTDHLLAQSESVGFQTGRGPEQIHLALTGRIGEMRVMFVTGDGRESFIRYGPDAGGMKTSVATGVSRYERDHMCDSPANHSLGWRDPGFVHDGVISGLRHGRRYYYTVGSDSGGWSKTQSFVSPDSGETIAFLFGDMGTAAPYSTYLRTQSESLSTIKWIARDIDALGDKPAVVSHIGDISYARGHAWLWDNFFHQIQPVASRVPYHVCIGNHEYDWPAQPWKPDWSYSIYGTDGGGECGVPYSVRFHMPGNSSEPTGTEATPPTRNLYYSFDAGVVHFVYLSTETDFLEGSSQYEFLKRDLEGVDRGKTPFVVVQGHRPMYTTSYESRDAPLRERLQRHLEPLFLKNRVTLALWGHVHRYERFCPLNNFTCGSSGGVVHMVIGMGGQDWQPIWEPRPTHVSDPIFPQPGRSMYRGGEFGYVRLAADGERMRVSYVGNHDGEVHDSVEILASGEVLPAVAVDRVEEESRFRWYVKMGSVVVLGGFLGYVMGFLTRNRREDAATKWTAVKTD
ncbi:hypothetical protein M569_08847, partial [Genlisea aurea]